MKLPRGKLVFWLGLAILGVGVLIYYTYWGREGGYASLLFLTATFILGLGVFLMIVGMGMSLEEEVKSRSAEYTCPRCHAKMTRQSSPKNCEMCDLPIDWSKASTSGKERHVRKHRD